MRQKVDGTRYLPFAKRLQDSGVHLQPDRQIARKLGSTCGESAQGLAQRCPNLQRQRRGVENKMQTRSGPRIDHLGAKVEQTRQRWETHVAVSQLSALLESRTRIQKP